MSTTTKTEGIHTGEFLLSEASGTRSREEIVIAAAAGKMQAGTVLGKLSASGKYVAYDNTKSDGSEVAAAILYAGVEDVSVDQKAVAFVRDCEVATIHLTGIDAAGKADLSASGVVFR